MGSLTTCLKKAGDKLDSSDRVFLHERAAALRKQGKSANEAATMAVDERLAEVRRLIVELDPAAAARFEAEDAQEPAADAASRLTDAGEELIRNRRSKLKGLAWGDVSAMNDTLKVAQVVKTNVWPRPNYAKMVEDGEPAWKAAVLKAVYDKIGAAPTTRAAPTDADLKAYIETLHQIRDALMAELDRVQALPGGAADLWKTLKASNVFGKVFLVPADAKPLYGSPSAFDRKSEQGKANNHRALLIGGNGPVDALQFSNRVLSKVKDLLADGFPAKQEAWEKSYEVRQTETRNSDVPEAERTGEPQQRFYVYEKGSRYRLAKGVQDGGYASREAAEAFARSLLVKTKKDVLPPSRGLDLADATRTGPDWRNGKDVTAQDVIDRFGFRGVNLGEYVKAKQGMAQLHLNHVFDAFSDLADLLGVPPKAMSLNGTLGVAVGAQGSGKALAHFVPGVNEINITRDSGAGALAHEFGHAMDHYFATQHGRAVSMAKRPYLSAVVEGTKDAGAVRPEVMDAMREVMKTINSRPMSEAEVRKYIDDQRALNQRRMDRWVTEFKGNKGADPAALAAVGEKLKQGDIGETQDSDVETNLTEFMRAAGLKPGNAIAANVFTTAYRLRDLADEARFMKGHVPQVDTDYAKASAAMDAKRQGDGYWSTPWEKFARAFETFAMDALKDRQRESLYLSGLVDSQAWKEWAEETGKTIPYPSGDERLALQLAFQKMVDTIQVRNTDKGAALFSRAPSEAAAAWTLLAQNDELFTFPRTDAKDMAGIVSASDVKLTLEPIEANIPSDVSKAWFVYPPGKPITIENRGFIIQYKDGRVEINVSKFERGDAGAQVYAIAGAYAHNNGLEFAGDRMGISDIGAARRLENMISLALKFGTTDFMSPHPDMLKKLGLDWRTGDSDHNLAAMLQASYRNATDRVPALKDIAYDPDTDSLAFLSTGERVTDAEANRIAAVARAKGLSIGRRSLQRIALTRSFADAAPGDAGTGLAGSLRAWAAGTVELPSSLRGVLYDRGATEGMTPAEAAAIMALPEATRNRLTGQRPTIESLRAEVDKLTDWPRVSVANSVDDLPPAQRKNLSAIVPGGGVRGVYFPDTDHIWLFAEHLHSAAEAKFVLLHEAFHRGLAKTIGGDSQRLLRQMYHTNGKLQRLTKQQMKAHGIKLDEAIEEALADLAGKGEARDLKGWAKLVDMIRGWLSDVGRALGLDIRWADDMIADFVAGAARAGLAGGAHVNPAADARMSRTETAAEGGGPQTAQGLVGESGGVFDLGRMGRTKQDRLRTVIDGSRPFWLGALTRDQIADIYGKDIPPVKDYDTLTRAMENQRSKIAQDADTIYSAWAKLDSEVNDRLGRVMLDATVHSVHPDGEFKAIKSNDAETEAERKKVHKRIRREFAELPKDAQAMYATVRDFHSGMLEQLKGSLEKRIERQVQDGKARAATLTNIRQMFDKYKEHGPYFPLSRFGDYLVIGTRPDGERVVASYETAGEQATAARALRKEGFTVKMKTAKDYSRAIDGSAGKFAGDVLTMLNDLDMAEASIGGKAADLKTKLMDDVNQLFIRALPDLSYRKHFAHRKNTPGFSSDVMRGFASSAFHAASHIARLNHADQMGFALEDAYKAIDQVDDGDFNTQTQVLNELAQRHDAAMNPNTHPIAAMFNQVGFVMYLGASPAAGLVNLLQTPMVTLPYLGAHFGFGKAAGAMAKATKDIMGAKANRQSGWDATQSDKLTQVERDTMRKLQDEGVIDLTQAHDLSAATGLDTGNVARSKAAFAMSRAMKIVGWTFHVPEVMNRQVTALTAYRLEMEKSGDQAKAEEAAREAIKRTHFDYSSSNRARFMQGNVARVLLQFKQYSQNMTYLLGRAAYQAMKGESPEVRAIARRQLVATLASTFVMAGALGLPGLGALAGAIGMMISGWDDDDEPWDWKVEFRNLMADTFGKEVGEVLSHGVPRALMPWDLSNRVGMGDMWFRSSDREGQNPREAFADDMKNILGPTAGTLLGLYTASDHMARGNWGKAAEAIVPKAIRDPLQASRMATEGVTSYNGEHLKDLTDAETVGKLLGFTPASVSEMYEGRNAIKNAETAIMDKRKLLISRAARARMEGDKDGAAEAMAEIQAFNKRNPQEAIKGESIAASILARRRHERQTADGTYLPPKRDHLREVGRFAGSSE